MLSSPKKFADITPDHADKIKTRVNYVYCLCQLKIKPIKL